jgi:hypothetical protein
MDCLLLDSTAWGDFRSLERSVVCKWFPSFRITGTLCMEVRRKNKDRKNKAEMCNS